MSIMVIVIQPKNNSKFGAEFPRGPAQCSVVMKANFLIKCSCEKIIFEKIQLIFDTENLL